MPNSQKFQAFDIFLNDETLPIKYKPKHPKKGEHKEQNGRTLSPLEARNFHYQKSPKHISSCVSMHILRDKRNECSKIKIIKQYPCD
jgi:hypothetical protein